MYKPVCTIKALCQRLYEETVGTTKSHASACGLGPGEAKGNQMDTLNSTPTETESTSVPTPLESTPEATAAPAETAAPVATPAPAAAPAPAPVAAVAPAPVVPAVKTELPKTD